MFANSKHLMLVGLLAAVPSAVLAQADTTAPAESGTMPDATMPDTTVPGTTTPDAIAPETGTLAPEAMESEAPTRPVEGQIILQSENTLLANDLIGRRVYSGSGETVGDINDLIVNLDGTVEGVVIGVGGFLGMGEKMVAVEISAITLSPEPSSGNIRLVLTSTREDLEAAPEFKTAEQQRNEAAADQMQQPMKSAVTPEPAQ